MAKVTYQVGGSLPDHTALYVTRQADKDLYNAILTGKFCYVFNARQMGKSSLRARIQRQLDKRGDRCVYLDMTQLGSEGVTYQQWYRGVMLELLGDLNLLGEIDIRAHWRSWQDLPIVQQLRLLLDQILEHLPDTQLFILVDEIDTVLGLDFPVNDFFAFIRACHEQRQHNPAYQRLTWVLFGVAAPSDLIRDRRRTPFNIGHRIDLQDFQLHEAQPLMIGFKDQVPNPGVLLKAILDWTGGQPLLTHKLCQLVAQKSQVAAENDLPFEIGAEAAWISDLVKTHVIRDWEFQDTPEHLRTIRNRLLMDEKRIPRLLRLYQQILEQGGIAIDSGSAEQMELVLSGLVCRQRSQLVVKNRIYKTIFSQAWIRQQLDQRRSYSAMLQGWLDSRKAEPSWLLRGEALREAWDWSRDKSLGDVDYQFLQASQLAHQQDIQQRLEAARLKEANARFAQERRAARLKSVLLGLVSFGFLGALGLSIFAGQQYYAAKLSEVKALASSSQGQFASNQRLNAMVDAIKAQLIMQRFRFSDEAVSRQVDQVLNQAIFSSQEVNRLTGHEGAVLGIDKSPNGALTATASNDKTVKLWRKDGTLLRSLPHDDTILRVAFSPDSQRLVTGSLDGQVIVWTIEGTAMQRIPAHNGPVWGVDFSPSGALVASSSGDRSIKLWQSDGALVATLDAPAPIWSVAFSPDGQRVAGAVLDGTVRLWSQRGEPLQVLSEHQAPVWDVAFCPVSGALVSVSSDSTAKIWSEDGQPLQTLTASEDSLTGVDCSDNGRYVATGGQDNNINVWTTEGRFVQTIEGHNATVRDVAFGQGRDLTSISEDGTVKVWQRNPDFLRSLRGHEDTVWGIAVSSDSQRVASAAGNVQQLLLWQDFQRTLGLKESPLSELFSVAFVPNQPLLAGVGGSSVRLLKLEETPEPRWTQVWEQQVPTTGSIMSVSVSSNGQQLASGADDGVISIWNLDGERLNQLETGHGRIWQTAFQPMDEPATEGIAPLLAVAAANGAVELWRTDGQRVLTLKDRGTAANWGVAISPDGTTVAAASYDDTLRLWQTDGTLLHEIKGNSRGLTRIAFSPDGKTLATGGLDASVKLWNRDGTLQNTLVGHDGFITSLTFSPDGQYLYSGGLDSQLIAWDLEKISALKPLKYACKQVKDYLRTNADVPDGDRTLCTNWLD